MKKISKLATIFTALFIFAALFAVTNNELVSAVGSGFLTTASSLLTIPMSGFNTYLGVAAPVGKGGAVLVSTSERDRAVYEHNKNKFPGKKQTPAYLRLETKITNANPTFTFKLFEGDANTVRPTEIRLSRNDKFICHELGFFLMKEEDGKTNGELFAYPNVTEFGQTAADHLKAIYNGQLNILVGTEKKLINYDLLRFKQPTETQKSAISNYDQNNGKAGFTELTPQFRLDGSGSNELEIRFPSYAGWAGGTASAAGFSHYAVLYLRGFLVTAGSANK